MDDDLVTDILQRVCRAKFDDIIVALGNGYDDGDELQKETLILGAGELCDVVLGEINSIFQVLIANFSCKKWLKLVKY